MRNGEVGRIAEDARLAMSTGRKGQKLDWTGEIASTQPANATSVTIKGRDEPARSPTPKASGKSLSGSLKIRRETKKRNGHPVSVLFDFSDGGAKNPGVLESLCRDLKSRLGCGGTVDGPEVVLQTENRERLSKVLIDLGLAPKLV